MKMTDCIAVVQSCTNPAAYNYNPNANEDNGSCLFDQNHVDSLTNYYQYFLNQYNTVVLAASILQAELDFADPNSFGKIELNLIPGWNTVGYNVIQPTDIVAQFEPIEDDLRLVKNNFGNIYWPQFGFNGIGDLIPGQGYQLFINLEHFHLHTQIKEELLVQWFQTGLLIWKQRFIQMISVL